MVRLEMNQNEKNIYTPHDAAVYCPHGKQRQQPYA